MRQASARAVAVFGMILLALTDVGATCGGGGGGGTGGMSGAGEEVYPVPWKMAKAGDTLVPGSLIEKLPVVVLAQADGKVVGRARNKDGFLRVAQLKKLGVTVESSGADLAPVFDRVRSAEIERTLRQGLAAKNAAKYTDAERLYRAAARLDRRPRAVAVSPWLLIRTTPTT